MNLQLTDWDQDLPPEPEEEYQAFIRTLQWTDGFGLLFVRCSPREGEELITKVQGEIKDKNIQVLRLQEPVDNLYQRIEQLENPDKIDILFITGLESSFYAYEESKKLVDCLSKDVYSYSWKSVPPVLINLNQQRERLKDNFNTCFVFLLPLFGIKYFIQRAPDFFDWRSGSFDFPTDLETLEQESSRVLQESDYEKYLSWTSEAKTKEIVKIQELIAQEYQTIGRKSQLFFELGLLFYADEDYIAALTSYNKAVAIEPDYYLAWNNKGIALNNLGRYEQAITSHDKAVAIKPEYQDAWYNRGIALGKLRRYEEAIASYDKAVAIKPDFYKAWYNRACAYSCLGNIDTALENLKTAINLNPEYREMAKTDSDFDRIRNDGRFQALIKE